MDVSRRLLAYAAGAAAAGVASAESADAAIVSFPGGPLTSGSTIDIDFDPSTTAVEYVVGHGVNPNNVALLKDDRTIDTNAYVTNPAVNNFAAALPAGTIVGPDSTYANTYNAVLAHEDGSGNFNDNAAGNPQYVGVRFQLTPDGQNYYGWIGVDIQSSADVTGVITGWAYENTGGPIAAGAIPEPAGLALLAMGAPFLMRRRRA